MTWKSGALGKTSVCGEIEHKTVSLSCYEVVIVYFLDKHILLNSQVHFTRKQ
jgi:hypothetical protein